MSVSVCPLLDYSSCYILSLAFSENELLVIGHDTLCSLGAHTYFFISIGNG
jgi:hypothetical protein